MQAIRVALFGAGSFGRHHLRHLSRHPSVAAVVVIDPDKERAGALARDHGAFYAPTLAAAMPVDAAVIAAPTVRHHELAREAIGRGLHVLVEKPIAVTDDEARDLVDCATQAGVRLQVGHLERYGAAFEAIRACAKRPHRIVAVRHNVPRPTPSLDDVVLDLMIHDVDLALTLAASPVQMVRAAGGREAATASLVFANGTLASLSASRLAGAGERSLAVTCGDTVFSADLSTDRLIRRGPAGEVALSMPDGRDKLRAELDAFLAAVIEGRPVVVSGEAGAAALEVANRILGALVPAAAAGDKPLVAADRFRETRLSA